MSYRPEDWKNPYTDKGGCWEHLCFERGADTILEALLSEKASFTVKVFENLRKGSVIEIETPPLSEIRKQIGSGRWVFVPDDKE